VRVSLTGASNIAAHSATARVYTALRINEFFMKSLSLKRMTNVFGWRRRTGISKRILLMLRFRFVLQCPAALDIFKIRIRIPD
jgi:hypothetical protein